MDHNADAPTLFGDSEVLPHYEGWLGSLIHIEPLFVEKLAVVGLLVDAAATAVGEAAQIDPTLVVGFDHAGGALHRAERHKSILDLIGLLIVDHLAVVSRILHDFFYNLLDLFLNLFLFLRVLAVPALDAQLLPFSSRILDLNQQLVNLEVAVGEMDVDNLTYVLLLQVIKLVEDLGFFSYDIGDVESELGLQLIQSLVLKLVFGQVLHSDREVLHLHILHIHTVLLVSDGAA